MKNECKQTGTRIPVVIYQKMEQIVTEGRYLNVSDFIRVAVHEKVDREYTQGTSKKEIEK